MNGRTRTLHLRYEVHMNHVSICVILQCTNHVTQVPSHDCSLPFCMHEDPLQPLQKMLSYNKVAYKTQTWHFHMVKRPSQKRTLLGDKAQHC